MGLQAAAIGRYSPYLRSNQGKPGCAVTLLHPLHSRWYSPAGPEVVGSIPASPTGTVRFRKLFPALVPSFPFRTWRSLRWGMSGLTPSDPFSQRRLSRPEL
eukprot:351309-Chlamydomonas_euryale.AAC.7